MSQNTWTIFGNDPDISTLDPKVQACLPPNEPTQDCDKTIGYAGNGGFCDNPNYQQTTYCACVNNAVACPQFSMAACANAAYSYKPWSWYQTLPNSTASKDSECSTSPICVNLLEIGGEGNLTSNITQQCGVITNITNILKTKPTFAILLLILFIALIIIMSLSTQNDQNLPPPPNISGIIPFNSVINYTI